tara:strand:- start:593 stop:2479 length:1887 start_codon:yes stop_codon:yes gene_type:complete
MARITKQSTGPVKSTLDSVVDKLKEMNDDQTALQKESIIYANELQDYVQNEGHQLTNQQIITMQEMILALREGRLDDIEASREELVRQRAEEKRDEKRNDFLKDNLKQLKKQYKLLLKMFKDDKSSILGMIFRTAVVGLVIGVVQGFLSPYVAAIKKVATGIKTVTKDFVRIMKFPELFAAMKQGLNNIKVNVLNFFKNTKLAKFFQGAGKGSLMGQVFTEVRMIFKDLTQIVKNLFFNLKQIGRAIIGVFTGAPVAFAGLKDMRLAITSNSKFFAGLGALITTFKGPFIKIGNNIKTFFTGMINSIGGVFDKALKFFGGVEGTKFAQLGDKIRAFFAKSGPLSRFFGFFQKLQAIFIKIGQAIGSKLLFPIFGTIGGLMGAFEDIKGVTDKGERIIRGFVGFTRGAVRILIGEFLDLLLITIPAFILKKLGFTETAEAMSDGFSFAEFFDNMYFAVADFLVNGLNLIRDTLDDIGFGGIIKNMLISIGQIFTKIADFPIAIAKGAFAALTTRFRAGPKERMEAFSEAFREHMSNGLTGALEAKKTKMDGLDSEGNEIDFKSRELQAIERATNNFGRGGIDASTQNNITGGDTFNLGGGSMLGSNTATAMRMLILSGGGGGFQTSTGD